MLPALLALCSAAISQAPQASPIEQELAPDAVRFAPGASTATPSLVERRARVRNFLAQRATPGGTRAQSTALEEAVAEHAALVSAASGRPRAHLQGTSSLSAPWTPLGPTALLSPLYGAVTGRVTALAPDPNDPTGNTLYIGTTGGGVWKSTNAAGPLASVSFVPLTDTLPVFSANAGYSTLPSLSIGALAVQSAPNPVLLAGTGDPNDATDSLYGEGILRSADGGLTWTVVAGSHDGANGNHSFAGLATAALAWSTRSPGLAVAAFSSSLEGLIVGANGAYSVPGLYVSTDAGTTWSMAFVYDGAQVVQQPTAATSAGISATSVVWNAQRGRFYAALRGHGYYSSADGVSWTRLTAQPGTNLTTANCPALSVSTRCTLFRGTLAVQPATGDMYALSVDANDKDQGLWQDLCNAGPSGSCSNSAPLWGTRLDNGALEVGSGSTVILQGDYDLTLAAVPASGGGTLLFAGTVDLYRCALSAGGTSCTFRNTTNALNGCNAPAAVSPAQHALAGMPLGSGSPLVFLGNDGGLWRSTDGVAQTGAACSANDRSHFDNLNTAIAAGGSLAEITGFAQDPTTPDVVLAGIGELGSGGTSTATSLAPWPQLAAGEGGIPLLDPNTPSNWFLTIGAGVNLKQCTAGSACAAANFASPATIGAAQVSNDVALLDAPALLDPAATGNVLVGTCRVWRGSAGTGSTWNSSNTISASFGIAGPCTASSPLVRSLAAGGPAAVSGNTGSTVIYAGMAGTLDGGQTRGGHVFVTKSANTASGATAWTDAALGRVSNDFANAGVFNALGFDISSIAVDTHDSSGATVYATVMGFGSSAHLYQSTDFGAHWLNISSNLPSAPANAVIVDPNDANTLYVALDTGVYATQNVNTCSSVNCWSVLGTALPNSPVVALAAAPNLPTGDGRVGMLRAGTYGRGLWHIPLLTAASPLKPAITVSAVTLTFATQQVATQSDVQTLTITSTGNAPVTFSTLALTGDYVEDDTCTGQTISVGSACTVALRFAPTAVGPRVGQLTLFANVANGQATYALNGQASAPASVVLTPLSLTFSSATVNAALPAQTITVSNTGGTSATLSTPVVTGDFFLSASTCGSTLPPQNGCSLSVGFQPTASGKRSGTLSVVTSVGSLTAQLTGSGNAPATDTLTPNALTFSQQAIGSNSTPQAVVLTNAGDVPLTLIAAAVSPGDFAVINACGNSLAAHSSCTINVAFVPTTIGSRTATLTVTDQFRYQTVSLSGSGIAPAGVSLSPVTFTFAATGVGLAAPTQQLTLTNNGGLPLHIQGTALTGSDFTVAATNCAATLDPGAVCNYIVRFTPTAPGPRAGTLTLTDDGGSGSQTATLSGTGVDFTIALGGPPAASVLSGDSATFPLLLDSTTGLSGTVAFTCSGAPAHSMCTVFPANAPLGSTVSIAVTLQTGLSTARLRGPAGELAPGSSGSKRTGEVLLAFGLPCLLVAGIPSRRGRQLRSLPLLLLLALPLCLLGNGCGASRVIPQTGAGGSAVSVTPAGVYNITVAGTSTGVTHTVALSLTVK